MAIDCINAGRVICGLAGWTIPPIKIQRILYVASMMYVGRHREPFIRQEFYAWKYGPIQPELYDFCKDFGGSRVTDVFPNETTKQDYPVHFAILKEICEWARYKSDRHLLSYVTGNNSAWGRIYKTGRNHIITWHDMRDEHDRRKQATEKEKSDETDDYNTYYTLTPKGRENIEQYVRELQHLVKTTKQSSSTAIQYKDEHIDSYSKMISDIFDRGKRSHKK